MSREFLGRLPSQAVYQRTGRSFQSQRAVYSACIQLRSWSLARRRFPVREHLLAFVPGWGGRQSTCCARLGHRDPWQPTKGWPSIHTAAI